jgi:hypothetical protein
MCAKGQVQGWKSLETKEEAKTRTHGQNWSNFIHGMWAVIHRCWGTHPWMSKCQLDSHILDEGVHPRVAPKNRDKLQPERRDAMSTVYSRDLQSQVINQQHLCYTEGVRNVNSLALNRLTVWGRVQPSV